MFRSSTAANEDGTMHEYECTEFGKDSREDLHKEWDCRVKAAIAEGLSQGYSDKLCSLLHKHKQIFFRRRLGSEGPAYIAPMRIKIDTTKKPVTVKVCKYPVKQRKFLDSYLDQLVEMGYLQPNTNDSWQAAPHLVAKELPNSQT